jgi:ankyrin repeat protein
MGLQNAFHLSISYPNSKLLDLLQNLKVNPDEQDFKKLTPFNIISSNLRTTMLEPTMDRFISSFKVRIDLPDEKGRTAFLNFYQASQIDHAYKLLQLGANVNQIDSSGFFALKYAMVRRNDNEINKLVKEHKANINQIDGKGRNLLHHAVNLSSATADASFDTEQTLLDLGININLRDAKNRTPLHYAFVKISDWRNKTQVDPIETVSGLCGSSLLEIDIPDKWLKTPLHYAS